jgi:hypothetical protein
MTAPTHHDLAERDLLPDEHYVDSGCPRSLSGEFPAIG